MEGIERRIRRCGGFGGTRGSDRSGGDSGGGSSNSGGGGRFDGAAGAADARHAGKATKGKLHRFGRTD